MLKSSMVPYSLKSLIGLSEELRKDIFTVFDDIFQNICKKTNNVDL